MTIASGTRADGPAIHGVGRGRSILARVFACAAYSFAAAAPAWAQGPGDSAQKAPASHHVQAGVDPVRRTLVTVPLGHVRLVREDGVSANLEDVLLAKRPVYVDFFYTTCTALCPLISATFAALQEKLASSGEAADLISISIDPEQDTPPRLRDFRQRFDAGSQWHFFTGTLESSIAAQRAFGVFTGDKMLHAPVILFRSAPGEGWVRFDGFVTPEDLYREMPGGRVARQ